MYACGQWSELMLKRYVCYSYYRGLWMDKNEERAESEGIDEEKEGFDG